MSLLGPRCLLFASWNLCCDVPLLERSQPYPSWRPSQASRIPNPFLLFMFVESCDCILYIQINAIYCIATSILSRMVLIDGMMPDERAPMNDEMMFLWAQRCSAIFSPVFNFSMTDLTRLPSFRIWLGFRNMHIFNVYSIFDFPACGHHCMGSEVPCSVWQCAVAAGPVQDTKGMPDIHGSKHRQWNPSMEDMLRAARWSNQVASWMSFRI